MIAPIPQITLLATPIEDLIKRLKPVLPEVEIYNSTNKAMY
jgi:hypothetical protein